MFDSATGNLNLLQVVTAYKYSKNNEQRCLHERSEMSCILNSEKLAVSAFCIA